MSASSSSQESEPLWQEASPVPQSSNTGASSSRDQAGSEADMMIRHQAELERMIEEDFAQGDDLDSLDQDDQADLDE